jgi:hypothetical protein
VARPVTAAASVTSSCEILIYMMAKTYAVFKIVERSTILSYSLKIVDRSTILDFSLHLIAANYADDPGEAFKSDAYILRSSVG